MKLPIINQNLYNLSYNFLSGESNVSPFAALGPVSVEYLMATLDLLKEGKPVSNFSITAVDKSGPEVAQFAKDLDFRNFEHNQEFVDAVASSVEITYLDDITAQINANVGFNSSFGFGGGFW